MKSLRNYGMAFVAVMTFVMTSCGGGPIEHGMEYTLEAPVGTADVDLESAELVLANRLNNFGLQGDYEISRDSNRIKVRVRSGVVEDNSRMRTVLQSSANVTFRSMYNLNELSAALDGAQQTYIRINHIDSVAAQTAGLLPYIAVGGTYPDAPLIFTCRAKDTTAVMTILRHDSIAPLFPTDMVFHWGAGVPLENGQPTYGLFACKVGMNYVMNGNYVESADAKLNPDFGSWQISLAFDPIGAKEFARITEANVNRSLAIELDDFVCSYPRVNASITGGAAQITGNFSEEQATDLAKILSAGKLPVRVALVEEKTF